MTSFTTNPPAEMLSSLIDRHGLRRVALALLAALLRRRRRRTDACALSDHLRRDIGLPPGRPDPRPPLLF